MHSLLKLSLHPEFYGYHPEANSWLQLSFEALANMPQVAYISPFDMAMATIATSTAKIPVRTASEQDT